MTPCTASGCGRPTHAKGLCAKHYQRSRSRGRRTRQERFWSKVEKTDTCWVWTGSLVRGYGSFFWEPGRPPKKAHRVSYEWLVAEIPPGLHLDHLCRNPPCVNPAHLEPVTSGENTRRSPIHDEWQRIKTHCPSGHPYSGDNLYVHGNRRHCRTCRRASSHARYQAKLLAAS